MCEPGTQRQRVDALLVFRAPLSLVKNTSVLLPKPYLAIDVMTLPIPTERRIRSIFACEHSVLVHSQSGSTYAWDDLWHAQLQREKETIPSISVHTTQWYFHSTNEKPPYMWLQFTNPRFAPRAKRIVILALHGLKVLRLQLYGERQFCNKRFYLDKKVWACQTLWIFFSGTNPA